MAREVLLLEEKREISESLELNRHHLWFSLIYEEQRDYKWLRRPFWLLIVYFMTQTFTNIPKPSKSSENLKIVGILKTRVLSVIIEMTKQFLHL